MALKEVKASPRVAFLLPSLRGGGVERVTLELSRGLVKSGLGVDLVLGKAEGPLMGQVPPGVRIVDLGLSQRLRLVRAYFPLKKYLRQNRPDWFIPVWDFLEFVPLQAAWSTGIRTLMVLHNTTDCISALPLVKRFLAWPTMRLSLRGTWARKRRGLAELGAVSKGVLDDFKAKFGLDLSWARLLPNPLDVQRVRALAREETKHPWSQGPEGYFLAVGRLHPQKGFDLALEAIALLKRHGLKVRLLILGEGPESERLLALRRRLGLEGDVEFGGFAPNPYPFIKRAKGLVMSSVYEGLPLVLLEALALGTPVVAARGKGGIGEALGEGRFGLLVERTAEGLAQGIARVMRGDYPRPSPEALQAHLSVYSLQNSVRAYLEAMGLGEYA